MQYDKTILKFYQLYYLLFTSYSLNLLRGPSHFGNVVIGTTEKIKYNPSALKINFSVLSTSVLKRMKTGYCKKVNPGLVEAILDIFEDKACQGKHFVLSFDGMQVSRGCKGSRDGDVDLWGLEGPPTVNEAIKKLEKNLDFLRKISNPVDSSSIHVHSTRLQNVLSRLTKKLGARRKRLTGEYLLEKKLEAIRNKNPKRENALNYPLARICDNTTQIENCVNRTLNVIFDITKTIAYISGIDSLVPNSKFVHLHKQTNYFPLLPSEYVSNYIDLEDEANTQFCSQRSEIWHRLRSKARITGSSMFRTLGFDTLKEEKEHCYVYCKGRPPKDFTPEVQRYIQFGCENEIHAILTFVGLAMSALLPPCYVFLVCGPMFKHGQNWRI